MIEGVQLKDRVLLTEAQVAAALERMVAQAEMLRALLLEIAPMPKEAK